MSEPTNPPPVNPQVRMVSLLLAAGARVDLPGIDARAPLHHAAFAGNVECARRLLHAGAMVLDTPSSPSPSSSIYFLSKRGFEEIEQCQDKQVAVYA